VCVCVCVCVCVYIYIYIYIYINEWIPTWRAQENFIFQFTRLKAVLEFISFDDTHTSTSLITR